MSDLSTVDVLRLIRAKMFEKQRSVNDLGRKLFSRPENLSKVFAGESALSPKAFAAFIRELEVKDPSELRLWLGSFLIHKESDLLSAVERAGLLEGLRPAAPLAAARPDDSWRVLSYHRETGELCGQALEVMEVAGRPLRAADVAAGMGILSTRIRSLLTKMETDSLICGLRRTEVHPPQKRKPFPPGYVSTAFPKVKQVSPLVEWELTPLGRKKLALWRKAKVA
jgi:hypothetical protein